MRQKFLYYERVGVEYDVEMRKAAEKIDFAPRRTIKVFYRFNMLF